MKCPNKNLKSWQLLEKQLGEELAYATWIYNDYNIPPIKSIAVLRKEVGVPSTTSPGNVPNIAKKVKAYNKKNSTAHSFKQEKIGESNTVRLKFRPNYLPVNVEKQRQREYDRKGEDKVFTEGFEQLYGKEPQGRDINYYNGDQALMDQEEGYYQDKTGKEKADATLDNKMKNFFAKIGVKYQPTTVILDSEGEPLDTVARARILAKTVEVIEGKASIDTLPEEAGHFYIESLPKDNILYQKLRDNIENTETYKDTYNRYAKYYIKDQDNPTPLELEKIAKEAMGKLIAANIVEIHKGNVELLSPEIKADIKANKGVLNRIWDRIVKMFRKIDSNALNKDINEFDLAIQIISEDILTGSFNINEEIGEVKEGVDVVFKTNPRLDNIGTQEQYSTYLDTIFPNSKIKDILYRGGYSGEKEAPSSYSYYTGSKKLAESFTKINVMQESFKEGERILLSALINTINPSQDRAKLARKDFKGIIEEGYDSVYNKIYNQEYINEIVNFNSEQLHILGSEKDIEGFKNYINSNKSEYFQLDEQPPTNQKQTINNIQKSINAVRLDETNGAHDYLVNGKGGYKSVTDEYELINKRKFKRETTKENESRFLIDRTLGTAIHRAASLSIKKAFPEHNKHIPEATFNELTSLQTTVDRSLQEFIVETKKNGGVLISEVGVSDEVKKTAGTVDLIRVNDKGTVDIFDYKSLTDITKADVKKAEWDYKVGRYADMLKMGNKELDIPELTVNKQRVLPIIRKLNMKLYNELVSELQRLPDLEYSTTLPLMDKIYATLKTVAFPLDPDTKKIQQIPLLSENTGIKKLDDMLKGLRTDIIALQKRLSKADTKEIKEEIKRSINNKRELITKVQEQKAAKDVLSAASKDIREIERALATGQFDPRLTLNEYISTAKMYQNLGIFLDKKKLSEEDKSTIANVQSTANDVLGLLLEEGKNRLVAMAEKHKVLGKPGAETAEKLLSDKVKETGVLASLFLGTSANSNPIAATIKKAIDFARSKYEQKSIKLRDDIAKAIEDVKKVTSGNIWDNFLQKDENGEYTGSLVDKVTREYWIKRKGAISNKNLKWMQENTNIDFESYTKMRDGYMKYINEIDKPRYYSEQYYKYFNEDKLSKEQSEKYASIDTQKFVISRIKNWEATYGTEKAPNIFQFNQPKIDKWKDSRYDYIQNIPELKKFYDLYISTIDDVRDVIPSNRYLPPNFIANFNASLIEKAGKIGYVEAAKDTYFKYDSISLNYDNTLDMIQTSAGDPIYSIPVAGISNLVDENGKVINAKNKSYDLGKVLFLFANSAYKYKELSEIEGDVLMANHVLQQQKHLVLDKKGNPIKDEGGFRTRMSSKGLAGTKQQIQSFIDQNLYNEGSDKNEMVMNVPNTKVAKAFGLAGKQISGVKILDNILKFVAIKNLGLNLYSPPVNLGQGITAGMFEGASGREYDLKDFQFALKKIVSNDKKARLLAKHFDIVQHEFSTDIINDLTTVTANKKWFTEEAAFALTEIGENAAQNLILIAMLSSGKHEYSWDDFDVKDDKLIIKDSAPKDLEELTFFKEHVKGVNKRIIGNYDPNDRMSAKNKIIFRALLQHRTWLPAMADARWGTERYDYTLDKMVRGRYKILTKMTGLKIFAAYAKSGFLLANKKEMEAKFDELDLADMKANMMEALTLAILFMLANIAFDDDDPKDDSGFQKYMRRTSGRLLSETSFFLWPPSIGEILISPVAATSTIKDIGSLMDNINKSMWYQPQEVQDRAKPFKYVKRLAPPLGQIDRFYHQTIVGDEHSYYY